MMHCSSDPIDILHDKNHPLYIFRLVHLNTLKTYTYCFERWLVHHITEVGQFEQFKKLYILSSSWAIDCKNQLYILLWLWQNMLNGTWSKSFVTIYLWLFRIVPGLNWITFLMYCTKELQIGLFELFKIYAYCCEQKTVNIYFLF